MNLTETGESRVNGYLFVLERSLKTFLPTDVVRDAVREIDSHLRERVLAADGAPNERDALEKILAELGPPLRVAQAYSAERTIDEAVATGRFIPIVRAVGHLASTSVTGFFTAPVLIIGYITSFAFFSIAVLKLVIPDNVGFLFMHGLPVGIGAYSRLRPDIELRGGYWVIPFALLCGLGIFVGTHRGARRYLAWWRARRVS